MISGSSLSSADFIRITKITHSGVVKNFKIVKRSCSLNRYYRVVSPQILQSTNADSTSIYGRRPYIPSCPVGLITITRL